MNAVRPVFGVAFAERGVVSGVVFGLYSANAVQQTRLVFGKRLCPACVRPVFGERGSANAACAQQCVRPVFRLCSALSMGRPCSREPGRLQIYSRPGSKETAYIGCIYN